MNADTTPPSDAEFFAPDRWTQESLNRIQVDVEAAYLRLLDALMQAFKEHLPEKESQAVCTKYVHGGEEWGRDQESCTPVLELI